MKVGGALEEDWRTGGGPEEGWRRIAEGLEEDVSIHVQGYFFRNLCAQRRPPDKVYALRLFNCCCVCVCRWGQIKTGSAGRQTTLKRFFAVKTQGGFDMVDLPPPLALPPRIWVTTYGKHLQQGVCSGVKPQSA